LYTSAPLFSLAPGPFTRLRGLAKASRSPYSLLSIPPSREVRGLAKGRRNEEGCDRLCVVLPVRRANVNFMFDQSSMSAIGLIVPKSVRKQTSTGLLTEANEESCSYILKLSFIFVIFECNVLFDLSGKTINAIF
jgi:hypothetical protein